MQRQTIVARRSKDKRRLSTVLKARLCDGVFVVQIGLGAIGFHFAVKLLWPTDTFSTSLGFRWFSMVAREETWGLIFAGASALCFPGLFVEKRWVQIGSAFISAVIFGLVAFGFYVSNPAGTGWGTYMILLGWSYWVLWMRLRARD